MSIVYGHFTKYTVGFLVSHNHHNRSTRVHHKLHTKIIMKGNGHTGCSTFNKIQSAS